jgi:acyl-CoA thioester hydrolase
MVQEAAVTKHFSTEMALVVRMYDIDFNGHVSNIVYIRWLEDMRMVGFEKIASMEECLAAGQVPVLLSTNIQYKLPIRMFQKPIGLLWISGFTKSTFQLEAEISVAGNVCAKATQICVFISQATNKAIRLPESVLAKFRQIPMAQLSR